MRDIRSGIAQLAIILCLLLLLLPGCKKRKAIGVGDQAPSIAAEDLSKNPVQLKQYPGKSKIVLFWDSACCSDELPLVEEIYLRNKDKLEVIGVNVLGTDSLVSPEDNLRRVINSMNITFPNGLDQMEISAKRYGVRVSPTYFFIDAKGVIRERLIGSQSGDILENSAVKLLGL